MRNDSDIARPSREDEQKPVYEVPVPVSEDENEGDTTHVSSNPNVQHDAVHADGNVGREQVTKRLLENMDAEHDKRKESCKKKKLRGAETPR